MWPPPYIRHLLLGHLSPDICPPVHVRPLHIQDTCLRTSAPSCTSAPYVYSTFVSPDVCPWTSDVALLWSDRAIPGDGGCYCRGTTRCRVTAGCFCGGTARWSRPVVDCFATILTAAHNFLAMIWPLVEILRSLVVYMHHHNKVYLRKIFAVMMWLLSNYFDLLCVNLVCRWYG